MERSQQKSNAFFINYYCPASMLGSFSFPWLAIRSPERSGAEGAVSLLYSSRIVK